jgi:hypothetical protein
MAEVGLNFLARQMERLIADNTSLRDDNRVLTAMMMRIDNSIIRLETRFDSSFAELLAEMRTTHVQITRIDDRVRKLEEAR